MSGAPSSHPAARRIAAQESARGAKARASPATTASATRHTASRRASVLIGPVGPIDSAIGHLLLLADLDRDEAPRFVERVNRAQRFGGVATPEQSLPARSFVSCSGNAYS